jgi:hypothetical protein
MAPELWGEGPSLAELQRGHTRDYDEGEAILPYTDDRPGRLHTIIRLCQEAREEARGTDAQTCIDLKLGGALWLLEAELEEVERDAVPF